MGWENLTPEEITIIAKLGAETSWSKTVDKPARTAKARDAAFQKFYDEVDPERVLPPEIRDRMAKHAQRAHMLRLSLKAATLARKRRQRELTGEPASEERPA